MVGWLRRGLNRAAVWAARGTCTLPDFRCADTLTANNAKADGSEQEATMSARHGPLFMLLSFLLVLPISCSAAALKPKLILAIVVDRSRYDCLTRFRAGYRDGLVRLIDNGAVFNDARYIQYPTVMAVGHSTFLSGATPSVSGIIDNAWYDRDEKREVQIITDSKAKLVGTDREAEGASPRRLLVSTLGDELKIADRAAKVIGMSIKDRGAILPAGHLADAAYWLDADRDHWSGFVSSDYYFPKKKRPDWVADFNNAHPRARFSQLEWKELDTGQTFCTIEDKSISSTSTTTRSRKPMPMLSRSGDSRPMWRADYRISPESTRATSCSTA
jgi:hypothetical protein